MMRRGFLDRLTGGGPPPHDELALVMRNLHAILNTQADYGSFVRGFGLGQYAEKRGTQALVEALTEEIQREVEHHEPRLREVEVKLVTQDSALWLHFELTALLGTRPATLRVLFDTVSGRVRVEKKE